MRLAGLDLIAVRECRPAVRRKGHVPNIRPALHPLHAKARTQPFRTAVASPSTNSLRASANAARICRGSLAYSLLNESGASNVGDMLVTVGDRVQPGEHLLLALRAHRPGKLGADSLDRVH